MFLISCWYFLGRSTSLQLVCT